VPHVELSLQPVKSSLDRWVAAVSDAAEACLVINAEMTIVGVSAAGHEALGLAENPIGRGLLDDALRLLDFGHGGALTEVELTKIPPLLALSGQLARGLLRVVRHDGETSTLDAIATPLHDGPDIVGSLTFFSPISAH
jgi:hypothetical protein